MGTLIAHKSTQKLFKIDEHIGCATSGLVADARVLVDRARIESQVHKITYGEFIPVETLVKKICDYKQNFTQFGGVRPFGTALLIAGVDDSGSHFTILTWDLAVRTFRRPAGSGDHGRASYRIRPLEEEAEKLLRELRRETTDRVRARVRSVPCLPPCSRTFVVAQACDRSGLEGLSSELFEQATRRKRAFRQPGL